MGNQRETRQVSPREGLGVVIPIRYGHIKAITPLLGDIDNQRGFYTYFSPAGEPLHFRNMDGPDIALDPQSCDHVIIQSGGKMWCGYEEFVDHIGRLAPHLENTLFYVGDEIEYIDEFRLFCGELYYRRVHEGGWYPVDKFIQSLMPNSETEPDKSTLYRPQHPSST